MEDNESRMRLDVVESRVSVLEESVNRAVSTLMPKVDALLTERSDREVASSDSPTSTTSTSLVEMAKRGDHEAILSLLVDVDIDIQRNPQRTSNGDTALHVAASRGHVKAAVVLLGMGAKVTDVGSRLRTPLHCAAAHGHLAVAQRLLFAGAQIDARDSDDATPLSLATGKVCTDIVNLLLRKGAQASQKDVFKAAEYGHWNLVELFLQNEAFLNVCNEEGDPLIVLAAKGNRWEMVKLLLEKGASATKYKTYKESALVFASQAGQADVVRELLLCGAASDALQVEWALGKAKSGAVVWAFVVVVPDSVRGILGEYSLREAAINGRLEPLVAFLNAGVNMNSNNANNCSALFYAAWYGHLPCLTELLNRGADFQSKKYLGNSPLHMASSEGHVDCVRALLHAGASTTERNNEGKTPLEVARSENVRAVLNEEQ